MVIEPTLIIKFLVSISVVLVLSYIAETVSAKWAGIIGGLPAGSAIILYFYAYENGLKFASESAFYNIIGLVAMQSFIFGYYASSKIVKHPGILTATAFGLILYLIVAFIISLLTISLFTVIIISLISFLIFIKLFHQIELVSLKNRIKLTFPLILARSSISGTIILLITTVAVFLGPKWSGIFSAFPTILYPLIFILHLNYGKQFADSVIKFVPYGLGGLLVYSLVIHISYKFVGINLGVVLAFASTVSYLFIFFILKKLLT